MDQNLLNALCLQQLTLSKVQEPETVAVLTRGSERTDLVDAFLWAAQQLGASAFHLRLPPSQSTSGAWEVGDSGLSRNPRAVEALKGVDMVIDLAFLLFSKEQFEIQGAGTRILTTLEIPEVLGRLMPTPELRERVEFGVETLQAAQSLRVTSPAGTDVTYRLGAYPTLGEYGYTDEPGRWDYWPAAFVFTGAADDGVDGTIVLSRATSCCRGTPTCRRRSPSPSRRDSLPTSVVTSTPTCCLPISSPSTIRERMECRTSAGASTSARTGTRWRPRTQVRAWNHAPSTAT